MSKELTKSDWKEIYYALEIAGGDEKWNAHLKRIVKKIGINGVNMIKVQEKPKPGHWEDDKDYPVSDWQYEVANNDTRLGYAEWVQNKKELDKPQ